MANEGKKVLIVDDEAETREFVQVALEDEGYQLLVAADGKAGLQKARAELPDLIILDIQMPEKDGLSMLHDLRQGAETKPIPVIILTGVAEKTGVKFSADGIEEYMGERPDIYIDKPVDADQLREAVRLLLSQ